jgi:hypothetical protein
MDFNQISLKIKIKIKVDRTDNVALIAIDRKINYFNISWKKINILFGKLKKQ